MLRRASCLLLALVALTFVATLPAAAADPESDAADRALDYLRTLQNPDGGFPAFGADSSAGSTIDAVFAFEAADVSATSVRRDGNSPLAYLKAQGAAYAQTPGGVAKLVLALVALDRDPSDFEGEDYVDLMESHFDAATHRYGEQVFDHILFLLARAALDRHPPTGAVSYLESKQLSDGCWEFTDGMGCDTNTTALAVQALMASGVRHSASSIEDALDYLADTQNDDGGFPYAVGNSDANSTAFVIQALVAADEDIDAGGPWDAPSGTPLEALLSFQNPDTGAFTYSLGGDDDAYATYQAVPALMLRSFPIEVVEADDEGEEEEGEEEETATPTSTATPSPTETPVPAVPSPTPQPAQSQPLPPTPAPVALVMPPAGQAGDSSPPFAMAVLACSGVLLVGAGLVLKTRRS